MGGMEIFDCQHRGFKGNIGRARGFFACFLPWRGNYRIMGCGIILWLAVGAVLFIGGNTPGKK